MCFNADPDKRVGINGGEVLRFLEPEECTGFVLGGLSDVFNAIKTPLQARGQGGQTLTSLFLGSSLLFLCIRHKYRFEKYGRSSNCTCELQMHPLS